MGMVTRCPACQTGFRVTPEQLQAHRGTVRCGRCSMVFNAFDSLTTLPDASQSGDEPEPALAAGESEAPSLPEPVTAGAALPEEHVAPPLPEPVTAGTALPEEFVAPPPATPAEAPFAESTTLDESAPEPARENTGSAPATIEQAAEVSAPQMPAEESELAAESNPRVGPPPAPDYDFTPAPSPRLRGRSARWLAGASMLCLLLAGQLGYVFRAEIAAAYPQTRPALERACGLFRCTVALPRQADQWSIESSDLQADPGRPSLVTLAAVLRNRSALAQDFPALELTLTDAANEPLARRVLTAEDYLPKGMNPRPGLGPNNEVVVRIGLETGNLNPVGYRLFLFYP
jgi:predicted Zn finger-like uncharacterized protein